MRTLQASKSDFQYTPYKSQKSYCERSTAQKFYDLEDSYKEYERLMQENLKLRNMLLQNEFHEKSTADGLRDSLEEKYGNKSLPHCSSSSTLPKYNPTVPLQLGEQPQYVHQGEKCNDMVLWAIKERNNFLADKVDQLKEQYQRQSQGIREVRRSEKWKNRFDCSERSCYQQKYLQLLRLRSPVLLE